jgi:acetyl-CoA hydrolase
MSELRQRIRKTSLHAKIVEAEETIPLFQNGMNLGFSGFGGGHPKTVPGLLADHVEKNNLQGEMRFNVFTGASIGLDIEDRWASLGMTDRRWPYQTGDRIRREINAGNVRMGDKHLSLFAQDLGAGFYTRDRGGEAGYRPG